jgi:hypothetical protein
LGCRRLRFRTWSAPESDRESRFILGRAGVAPLPPDRSLVAIAAPPAGPTGPLAASLTINRLASGHAGFLAQQIVQEVMSPGLDLPRWRDRAAAYAAPAANGAVRLILAA